MLYRCATRATVGQENSVSSLDPTLNKGQRLCCCVDERVQDLIAQQRESYSKLRGPACVPSAALMADYGGSEPFSSAHTDRKRDGKKYGLMFDTVWSEVATSGAKARGVAARGRCRIYRTDKEAATHYHETIRASAGHYAMIGGRITITGPGHKVAAQFGCRHRFTGWAYDEGGADPVFLARRLYSGVGR